MMRQAVKERKTLETAVSVSTVSYTHLTLPTNSRV